MSAENRTLAVTIVIALTSLILSGMSVYANDVNVILQRLSVLETQSANDRHRLERVENTLDRLYEFTTGRKP